MQKNDMKIHVIGGSGYIGTHLIELLKNDNDYALTNIDKCQSPFFSNITHISNVLDKTSLIKLLKGSDVVILLAAEHKDNVSPTSLYYKVNVDGMRNTLEAMAVNGVKRIIFTSSVAVYGLNKNNPNEECQPDPFNHYGKSKWQAECVLQEWYKTHSDWNINVIRPTVTFGERNRGNVYNLLKQISGNKFTIVGKGDNKKSMAYVVNVVSFIKFFIDNKTSGYNVYNYIDKPDFTMNELVDHVSNNLNKHIPHIHIPYWLGMLGGYCFDILSFITRKKLIISSVRVKKFCATTMFDSSKMTTSGFRPPYTLSDGLSKTLEFEFIHPVTDDIVFESE